MTVERFYATCRACFWVTVPVLVAGILFVGFCVLDDSPVLSVGGPQDIWLSLDGKTPAKVIHLDDSPQVGFGRISWLRDCGDAKRTQFFKIDGHRVDIYQQNIPFPGKLGPIPDLPKHRWIAEKPATFRTLGLGLTGEHSKFWMHITSTCWGRKIEMDTPAYEFDAVP